MTSLSSQHHSFDVHLAVEYGIEEAIIIHHFQHWIDYNMHKPNGEKTSYREGRWWTYQTIDEIAAWFRYLNPRKVKYAIDQLVEKGVLIKGNFNKKCFDKTVWYAFKDQKKFTKDKIVKCIDNFVVPIPDTKTDTKKTTTTHEELEPKNPLSVVVPFSHKEIISKPAVEKNNKEKLLERTKLTAPEQMGIKTKFDHLSDDVFTEAIEAFFEYERKNGSENYIALLKSALGANEYKKPWTKNQAVQTAQDKELERKKHEDKIFFRKYRVKAMKDKYETNKYFTRKDGHIIIFKIGEKFCEYQMRDMVRYAMIIYDSDNFEKEIDALEKEIEKRINAEKK
jgi:hypothetical protein